MTSLSIANYGNYYATNTFQSGAIVKNSGGAVLQPSKTAIRDIFTACANADSDKNVYVSPISHTIPTQAYSSKLPQFSIGTRLDTSEDRIWAFGMDIRGSAPMGQHVIEKQMKQPQELGWHNSGFTVEHATGTTRSQKMVVQSQMEITERDLNEQIDRALQASGISLDEKDRLNFNIDQFGKITITGGITDSKIQILEDTLNSDDAIRANLFKYQVQKYLIAEGPWERIRGGVLDERMMSRAYDWAHGNITGIQDEDNLGRDRIQNTSYRFWTEDHISRHFPLDFSYQDGRVFQGKDFPEDRVFSNRLDSLAGLGKIIGLDESAAKDIQSFAAALETNINADSSRLADLLNAALKKAKLGDITKKITFSQDADGNIVIEGNICDKQKKELAKIINDDSELSELIKTQSAKKTILAELTGSFADDPVNYNFPSAWKRHNFLSPGFDLSKDSLALAREQLLKSFLSENGIEMSDLKADSIAAFEKYEEFGEIKGLRNEVNALLMAESKKATKAKATEPQPLLAMKRGEIVETIGVEESFGIDAAITDIKQHIGHWINDYNQEYAKEHPGLRIIDYTFTLDHNGLVNFEVRTADGEEPSEQSAKEFLTTHFIRSDTFKELGLAILEAHDDEHGDIQEYKHSVVIDKSGNGYRIESPEADQAALQEMETLTNDIGSALGDFFGKTLGIENPFSILLNGDGKLSFDASGLDKLEAQKVKGAVDSLNKFLEAEKTGEDMENTLSPELLAIGEMLIQLQEAKDKIHDKSLLSEERDTIIPVAQNTNVPQLFSSAPESVNNFLQFFGLATVGENETLASVLKSSLETETQELNALLNALIQEVGIDNTTKNLTFYKDPNTGNIEIVGGGFDSITGSLMILGEEKKEKLENMINNDSSLVERMKDYMSKMEIVQGLENGADISNAEFSASKQQLLNSYLQREGGLSLANIAVKIDPDTGTKTLIQLDNEGNEVKDSQLSSLLSKMPGLEQELLNVLESPKTQPEFLRTVIDVKSSGMNSRQAFFLEVDGGFVAGMAMERGWRQIPNLHNLNTIEQIHQNPSLIWQFEPESKAFEGHAILDVIFPNTYTILASLGTGQDKYGFTYTVPVTQGYMGNGYSLSGRSINGTEEEDFRDVIFSVDTPHFSGLTLEERDLFYAEAQKIFDLNKIGLDARSQSFYFVRDGICNGEAYLGGWRLSPGAGLDHKSNCTDDSICKIWNEMAENPILRSLYEKAEGVRNGTIADDTLAQQYSIRVTDYQGNHLAKDRIIVEAKNGNHVEMSVEQFSKMSRLEVTKLLR